MVRWLEIAWQQEGADVCEIGGPQANASVVAYFHKIGRPDVTSDEVPWCAAFYFWCLQEAGIDIACIAPEERLLAWSATKLGRRIAAPRVGAGCVLKRAGGHHVAIVTKWTETTVTLLGGNQADSVCARPFKRTPDMIFMWPETVTPQHLDAAGSRIAKAARRVTRDTAKSGAAQATQILPPPPKFETLPELPAADTVLGGAQIFRAQVQTAMEFSTFLSGRWTWIMLAVAAYYGLRAIWSSQMIRQWRADDASTGKTVGTATPATDIEEVAVL